MTALEREAIKRAERERERCRRYFGMGGGCRGCGWVTRCAMVTARARKSGVSGALRLMRAARGVS